VWKPLFPHFYYFKLYCKYTIKILDNIVNLWYIYCMIYCLEKENEGVPLLVYLFSFKGEKEDES